MQLHVWWEPRLVCTCTYACAHTQLHSVLEESDRAIAVVKDLFGDDPKVHVYRHISWHTDYTYCCISFHISATLPSLM